MFEEIRYNNQLLAIYVSSSKKEFGLKFLTPDSASQQLAYMRYPAGKEIVPHIHKKIKKVIFDNQETLFIRSGKLRVDFYDNERTFLESKTLVAGDVLLLVSGGHGFEVLEETEIIEVKQGPYNAQTDKVKFNTTVENIKY
jgi:mannose-6-phosphate isomerase-like protein (cupin superfamily)